MSKRFNKKNSQKYVVVHRPHDDPQYYDDDAAANILVPASNHNTTKAAERPPPLVEEPVKTGGNEHIGEAALYGIKFDDSKYDYMQHLKPIGTDPENSLFIPAKKSADKGKPKKSIDDLFVEPQYQNADPDKNERMFFRGVARPEYLERQQNIPDELVGFRPDMNPALREALEALEDEAYVVNKDKKLKQAIEDENENVDDDDIFDELLQGGQASDEEEFEDNLDEWDIDNVDAYEDEHYQKEMQELDNVENFEDLKNIDYQADVQRFKKKQKRDLLDDQLSSTGPQSVEPEDELEELEEEENDALGDLPKIEKTKGKKRKDRQKMGTKSDVTGFSMTSSAIARTETMTVLDDKYDNIIPGYENYQDEQDELEEKQSKPFDMSEERSDFESMLDDFLDNYELGKGGREFHKKDIEVQNMKDAADEVSKGKLSQRRNRERKANSTKGISNSLSNLRI